jgi:hypothetical protein
MPKHQGVVPPLLGCPRLLIQYFRSYLPYLEAVSPTRNLRTHHAVVKMDQPNIAVQMTWNGELEGNNEEQ